MLFRTCHSCLLSAGVLVASLCSPVNAQQAAAVRPAASAAEATLEKAAAEGKYTFLVFYKTNDSATQAMTTVLKEGLSTRAEIATNAYVQVGQPGEKTLVDRFDVSRAPMPMTIAVAPNGAITGMFAQKLTPEGIENSFVTPTMTKCMKSLQEGKLVLVSVRSTEKAMTPVSLKEFQADPHFKDRVVSYSMLAADSAEGKFMKQMQLEAGAVKGTTTVLLAPPGVLVGKFDELATKDDIAGALAKAGKCCDDPNCKHHQQQQAAPRTATRPGLLRR